MRMRKKLHNEALHNLGDQVRKDEIGRSCSIYGSKEKYILNFGIGAQRKDAIWKTWTQV
jgi:hypothetical protein